MSETFRTTPPDQQWSGTNSAGNGYQGAFGSEPNAGTSPPATQFCVRPGLCGGLHGLSPAPR